MPLLFLFLIVVPEENIATMKYGAQVVKGELKSALLDGDTQNYDLDHGFSRHPIDDDCRSGIEIKLGQPSIINHIRILLWDRDSRWVISMTWTENDIMFDWVSLILVLQIWWFISLGLFHYFSWSLVLGEELKAIFLLKKCFLLFFCL